MKRGLRFAATAASDAVRIDAWWRDNRPAAPALFDEELKAAIALLIDAPDAGRVYRRSRGRIVRRILLRTTRFHVYYAHTADDAVQILAVHSAVRGAGPVLD